MRTAMVIVLMLSLAPSARAADVPQAAGRRAVVQIGFPKSVPTALDSVPHPWPGRALLLTSAGVALPILLDQQAHRGAHTREETEALMMTEVITPAAGHLYAGLWRRAMWGVGARAVGFGIFASAVNSSGGSDFDYTVISALWGITIMTVSAAADIVTVAPDVERRNRDWLREHGRIESRMLPSGDGPALALTVRF